MQAPLAETRALRAEQISASVQAQSSSARLFSVPSQRDAGKTYQVNLAAQSCACPDHQFRGVTCKHLLAAARAETRQTVTAQPQPKTYAEWFASLGI